MNNMKKIIICFLYFFFTTSSHGMNLTLDDKNLSNQAVNTITVSKDELTYWNNEKIDENEVSRRLKYQSEQNKTSSINLRADKDVRYEKIIKILWIVNSLKNINVNFVVQDPNQ